MTHPRRPGTGSALLRSALALAAGLVIRLGHSLGLRRAYGRQVFQPSTAMADWYFETDATGRFTRSLNSSGVMPGAAVLGKSWDQLPGVDPSGNCALALKAALAAGEAFQDAELAWREPAGRLHHALVSGVPLLGRGGRLCGYRGTGRDITALKEAQLALNASESLLATIIDSAMDAIITVDTAQRVVVFNESASAMFGCARSEALGSLLERFMPGGLAAVLSAQAAVARSPSDPIMCVRGAGQAFEVEAAMSRIDLHGRELYSITLRDLTERQALEHARVALEAQLRESQKMEALGTMAGGIAHDFNNIVAAILGNTALARASLGEAAATQVFVEEISKAGLRARDLVQRIMAFSRRQPAVFSRQPLQPLVQEAVQLLRATLPSGIEIVDRMPGPPLYVACDATQISQVLMNLGTNAWQALGSQPGRICVTLETHGQQEVRLEVSDNGCGMDEATLQRVFEPFFTTKAKGEGTGLGLPVVHGIVQSHGGSIAARSRKGEGATFDIYLPLAAAGEGAAQHALAQPAASPIRGQGQHVVYLDDYPAMVFMMKATLEARGYRVTGFESAQTALEYLRECIGEVDLVVSDYNMPGRSGLDMASEIRRLRPGLPVILASGCLTDELREGAARVGVRHLFDKPRGIEEMCEMVGKVLRERGLEPAAQETGDGCAQPA